MATLKIKGVISTTILIILLTKCKQPFYLRYQKLVQKIGKEAPTSGFTLAFQIGPNLKRILCKSKDKFILNSYL